MSSPNSTPRTDTSSEHAGVADVLKQNAELTAQVKELKQQVDVFKKLLFGKRSEKRPFDIPGQQSLFEDKSEQAKDSPEPAKDTITYQRGKAKKTRPDNCVTNEGLRFDDDVPVKHIALTPP